MIRNVNLIEHLPNFIQEYKEIKQTMVAENPEFQLVIDESEKIKNNQFIKTSDLVGITKFEKLLNIVPNPHDSLDSRISRVMTRWNDSIPYTYRGLIERLNILCGENNYTVSANFKAYEFNLQVYLPLSGQVNELEYMLSYMIPANFVVTVSNDLDYEVTGTFYMASTNVESRSFTITSELNHEIMLEGNLFNGSTISKILEYTIN
ncbi:putative phage tail protein [Vallitalea guaymasensis]|uniref:putative phage tail protein n=1 Tax=Vallitalea guaymasensis TaxID=1185412 RepID=UPI000DE521D9|nr:putative phage tail protein [Vallitalea guaymasensis]